jgi:hypothetical protein
VIKNSRSSYCGQDHGAAELNAAPVMAVDDTCHHCHRPLLQIDHYGERLIGCIECNRWGWPGSSNAFMALREEDLQALSNLSDARQKAEDTMPEER